MEKAAPKTNLAPSFDTGPQAVSEKRQTESSLSGKVVHFSVPTALLILLTSAGGIFFPGIYSGETSLVVAQASAQHWIHLVIVAPLLIIAALLMKEGRADAIFVWLGTMAYALYSFAVFCFTIRSGVLFPGYCALLGLSLYGILAVVAATDANEVSESFDKGKSNNLIMAYLWIVVLLFSSQWLKEIIPQMFSGGAAGSVGQAGAFGTVIHVLDLSIFLPGMGIAAILMRKRHPLGFVLAPSLIVFTIITNIAYAVMIMSVRASGLPVRLSSAWVFAAIAALGTGVFIDFLGHIRRPVTSEAGWSG